MSETTETDVEDGWDWALVEIFGHRSHAGRVRQEERFGAKMLRIDVPVGGDADANGWRTHYYGGASIFSITLTDEETARRRNRPHAAPARLALAHLDDDDDDGGLLHD